MPLSFYVALGGVVALGLGGLAYVWITSPPAKKPEPELELFPAHVDGTWPEFWGDWPGEKGRELAEEFRAASRRQAGPTEDA